MIKSLATLDEFSQRAVDLAVITHHKSIKELGERFNTHLSVGQERFTRRVAELSPHFGEVQELLGELPRWAREFLSQPLVRPQIPQELTDLIDPYCFAVQWNHRAWEDDERTPLHGTYGVLLRGLTIACDHLASAGKEEVRDGLRDVAARLGIPGLRPFQRTMAQGDAQCVPRCTHGVGEDRGGIAVGHR